MILQFGLRPQIDNLVTLIDTKDLFVARSLSTLSAIQVAYRNFIEHLQNRVPGGQPGVVGFVTDFEQAMRLRPLFVNDSLLDDRAQAEVIAETEDYDASLKRQLILRALDELKLYSQDHRILFDTVVTDIFILPSKVARAGSTSQAVGVIWANPRVDHTLHDVIEMLVHELTHHAMFIDEIRYSHYTYSTVVDRKTWATSAILNVPRPLDKVLHSAVVATGILLLREQLIGHPVRPAIHPPTGTLLFQLENTLTSMGAKLLELGGSNEVFLGRAWEIFDNLKLHVKRLREKHSPISIH